MSQQNHDSQPSRRRVLQTARNAAVLSPVLQTAIFSSAFAQEAGGMEAVAGVERVVVLPGKTYLRGWAGYGEPPSSTMPRNRGGRREAERPAEPAARVEWAKESGPGRVRFSNARALNTTATFSEPGDYVLRLTAKSGEATASSTVRVIAEAAPPAKPLEGVNTAHYSITSPLWKKRIRGLMVNWIPHCIRQINRSDIEVGPGGIDNFVEAGKKLRGEAHGLHKGYVFSNAWVYQTIEAMSLALMVDAQGDAEILAAHKVMRETLEDWIPKILAAQEPDGYLQTAYTLPREGREGKVIDSTKYAHWDPAHRGDHEGYVAGYLLEAAINHHRMSDGKDARLLEAARKLADCWDRNIGPAPKKAWYDGHQGMEQALVRFGEYIDEIEGAGEGAKYFALAKFLLDCRYNAAEGPRGQNEYDQSHVPVIEQYEAVGHAVRAAYTYSAMADVALATGDADYRSAARSVCHNVINRKYYVTGGIGSGETAEGFGPNYSLRQRAYNESCSSCGQLFFQWKMHRAWHDARYVDLLEETLYNALLGSMDLEAEHFYYDNPLEARVPRYQWHVCPCCVGNIPRTLLMLPTWTYSRDADGLYVNLFSGCEATLKNVGGTDVRVSQETDYPWSGKAVIVLNPATPKRFRVQIRMPNRSASEIYRATPDATGFYSIKVNGEGLKTGSSRGYAVLTRTWKAGDRIEVELPMEPQRVHAVPEVEATRGLVAFRYGPLIYNIEEADQDIGKPVKRDAALRASWRPDLLGGVVVIESEFADGSPLLAIPNFVRMNRVTGLPLPPPPPPRNADGSRPAPPPPKSIVWMREG